MRKYLFCFVITAYKDDGITGLGYKVKKYRQLDLQEQQRKGILFLDIDVSHLIE